MPCLLVVVSDQVLGHKFQVLSVLGLAVVVQKPLAVRLGEEIQDTGFVQPLLSHELTSSGSLFCSI
jgi:hypothetical protein